MKTFLSTLFLGLCIIQPAAAQGRIESAFGKKLGEVFDPGDTPNEYAGSNPGNQYQRYRFTPVAPFKGLTEYFVEVTPTTHRIHTIEAIGYAADETEARQLVIVLGMILSEKYAADPRTSEEIDQAQRNRPGMSNEFAEGKRIEQRDPSRTVSVSGSTDRTLIPVPRQVNAPTSVPRPHSVRVSYVDQRVKARSLQEAEVIKFALNEEWAAKYAAEQKKKAEAEAQLRAEAAEARVKELARLKEEASKLDATGL
jgi:hypothetical protein